MKAVKGVVTNVYDSDKSDRDYCGPVYEVELSKLCSDGLYLEKTVDIGESYLRKIMKKENRRS